MKTASIIIQPIVSVIGIFLLWLSFAMLIPGFLDFFEGNKNWSGFFISSVFTFFIGISFILMNRGNNIKIEIKSAFMLVVLSWFSLSVFASLFLILRHFRNDLPDHKIWTHLSLSAIISANLSRFVVPALPNGTPAEITTLSPGSTKFLFFAILHAILTMS